MLKLKQIFLCVATMVLFVCSSCGNDQCKNGDGCKAGEVCNAEGVCVDKQPVVKECDNCKPNQLCSAEGKCVDKPDDNKCEDEEGCVCSAEGKCVEEECNAEKACGLGYACKAGEKGAPNTCVGLNPNGCQKPEQFACTTKEKPRCITFQHSKFTECAEKPAGVKCPSCEPNQVCYVYYNEEGAMQAMCSDREPADGGCFNGADPLCPIETGKVCLAMLNVCALHTNGDCEDGCPEGQFCHVETGRVTEEGVIEEERTSTCKFLAELPEACRETVSCDEGDVCEAQNNTCFTPL